LLDSPTEAEFGLELDTEMPLPLIPNALGGQRPAIHISSVHTEPYGDYREAKGTG